MRKSLLAFGLVLSFGLFTGCGKEEEKPKMAEPPAAPANAVDAAKTKAADLMGMTEKELQAKLDEITQYVKDNKLDLAEKALSTLEANKNKLPDTWKAKLDEARKMLDTAKLAGKMPAFK